MDDRSKTSPDDDVFALRRQAVVLIHGIGHQRPMDSLRSFVDAVLDVDPAPDQEPMYYSKPEDLSGTFELRRLQSVASRPRTDYFELYWQHLIPTATWRKIYAWLRLLLARRPRDVPAGARSLWLFSWGVAIAVICLLGLTIVAWLWPDTLPETAWLPQRTGLPLGLVALLLVAQGVILNYAGDAAVYLSPLPDNIRARQAVREAGVALLERLHGGLDEDRAYDRIVVVGHSLGSVIGYDILTHAWPRFNEAHARPWQPRHDALKGAQAAAEQLWEASNGDGRGEPAAQAEAKRHWVDATGRLWIEQRKNRFPWLVTDFVTLGSPLAHGLLLLARNADEFARKKRQFELPTSPPILEKKFPLAYRQNYQLDGGAERSTFVLSHGALFAVTLWTNLFFPARFWLRGDVIGGAVAPALGPGVVDVPVHTARAGGWLAHTKYWRAHENDRGKEGSAIDCLVAALDIGGRRFKPSRDPAHVPPERAP